MQTTTGAGSPAAHDEPLHTSSPVHKRAEPPQRTLSHESSNAYKSRIRYTANTDFQGDESGPGVSAPNTFKHKNHPNAKTKPRIGDSRLSVKSDEKGDPMFERLSEIASDSDKFVEWVDMQMQREDVSPSRGKQLYLEADRLLQKEGWLSQTDDSQSGKSRVLGAVREIELRRESELRRLSDSESRKSRHPECSYGESQQHAIAGGHSSSLFRELQKKEVLFKDKSIGKLFPELDQKWAERSAGNSEQLVLENGETLLHKPGKDTPKPAWKTFLRQDEMATFWSSEPSKQLSSFTEEELREIKEDIQEQGKFEMKTGSPLKLFRKDYDTYTKAALTGLLEKVLSQVSTVHQKRLNKQVSLKEMEAFSDDERRRFADAEFERLLRKKVVLEPNVSEYTEISKDHVFAEADAYTLSDPSQSEYTDVSDDGAPARELRLFIGLYGTLSAPRHKKLAFAPVATPGSSHAVDSDLDQSAFGKKEVLFRLPRKPLRSPGPNVTAVSDISESHRETNRYLSELLVTVLHTNDWDAVEELDISGRGVQSIEGLLAFLPRLKRANVSHNHLRSLHGLPLVYDLDALHNGLDNMEMFWEYAHLHVLDVSHNRLTRLSGFQYNHHLTLLTVTHNGIGAFDVPSRHLLQKLELGHNQLTGVVDLARFAAPHLRELDLRGNQIEAVVGLEHAPRLVFLDVSHNRLQKVASLRHRELKCLAVHGNPLPHLDVAQFPYLRTLTLDGNPTRLANVRKAPLLLNVSARHMPHTDGVLEALDASHIDLTGSPASFGVRGPFFQLRRLDLVAVQLASIPANFCELFPSVREVNLAYNELLQLPLVPLRGVRSLSVLGNRFTLVKPLVEGLSGLRNCVQRLDVRLNPVTRGLYPHLLSPAEYAEGHAVKMSGADLESCEHVLASEAFQRDWAARDAAFHSAEKQTYRRRMQRCFRRLEQLDGIAVQGMYSAGLHKACPAPAPRACSRDDSASSGAATPRATTPTSW